MDYYATNPGPVDDSILYDQDKHVSAAVWEGQERGALRCHEHTSKLDRWLLTDKQIELAPVTGYTSGGMVKLSWLKETFSECPKNASVEDVECRTRAYLLYLIGSTVFSTTTGNKVPVMYLPLFEDFDEAGKYAWGAAALSFLYRALGNASLRWKGKHSGPTSNRDVVFYRKALDSLKPTDVEWCPYANISHTVIPEDILNQLILGRSKTMLICFDKAERHLPDRCLRQFGMHQTVPEEVQRWERKTRGVDGGVDLSGKMEAELSEWTNRRFHIVEAEEDLDEGEYMNWYLRITRKLVGRPIPISSEFQRMSAALRDIAQVADTLSTHGMDDQQIQSVTRIRYIAHECLRDHSGSSTLLVANSEDEVGKKIRGKERVRRRGAGKRRRKEDPDEEYYSPSFHTQPLLYPSAVNDDQEQLYHVGNEIDHENHCVTTNAGYDESEFQHGVEEADEDQLSNGSQENSCEPQPVVGVV
ncbi:serine/threonine-protein phosphatase 7 long form homolog [Phtheirospermum japonicum]|uniref:Serine/threonine-protein phosphatase 7 long form homolog n=1 Tax=Phtheirospermum japonicum TaxID=374723 RepID=A0A830B737_9LAMI|nr:serine/threonine-protein phosphatase 7 long form homolog [Phtheirospermum japonicum]